MAQFGFGININKTAQETGYDQYKTTLGESLGAVAAENWQFSPFKSIETYYDIEEARSMSEDQMGGDSAGIFKVDRKQLNEEYSNLGLYFAEDEHQSVVDIMVNQKKEERARQSIMNRGPQGSWNPFSSGFYVGAAKLGVGIGVSFLDPINIGASFIPVFGQVRFAQVAARTGLRTARAVRGAVEGAVGATILEPLVYSVAQKVQADYDLVDSFMNIGFGTVLGSGLHVGAGALKDIGTAQKFEAQIIKNKENLDIENTTFTNDLELPTKVNIGEFFNIFDVDGNIVNVEVTKVSSSGNSVKVKLPDGSEKIVSLDSRSVDFQSIKNPDYKFKSVNLKSNVQGKSISALNQKEIKTLKKELLERKQTLEKQGNINQGAYFDVVRDLKSIEFSINKKPTSKSVPELNLYKEYYPVNGEFMMKLEKTDPRTRELLLAKAIGDLSLDNPVNVGDILNADATLREGTANPVTTEIQTTSKNIYNNSDVSIVNKSIEDFSLSENDTIINRESQDLLNLRNRQTEQGLNLKTDFGNEGRPDVLTTTTEALDEINKNTRQVEETVADFINCTNGNT